MVGEALLAIDDLRLSLMDGVRLLDGVSLSVQRGEALGIVGESGSGKSLTALSVLRLVPGVKTEGAVRLSGADVVGMTERELRSVRGRKAAMVFQDPMTAFFPVKSVGDQIVEQIRLHRKIRSRAAWAEAVALLERMGVPDAQRAARRYPHQLSGGLRQRAMIAMALSCTPDLLIADEPTTALDVTVQAQILVLFNEIRAKGSGLVIITHDLGVVAQTCTRIAVMYAGVVVEEGATENILQKPLHPYTQALVAAIPPLSGARPESLQSLAGTPPTPAHRPSGCVFAPRCMYVHEACAQRPSLLTGKTGRKVACVLYKGAEMLD
ncbi:peptide ABC transporter ATP-binding protein [Neokomagataea thailandica NBRC 106555]|uniref:ABC transporter ATP-binding protein n=2 Tax=Neokomagataea TaxID=1223423 RepID=A0A4Y6V8U8_9PROT|nr:MULTISPECIES: ABC transporter ATP-binding protein [Neokomagataea]QDH24795.1 ABC transporter ATP-binding protein [Neokomagataea tanensis]GBR49976.1 peptide ABC transporter ATP-binding protein [Neokomagataea thailandica NBRC 106555]